ncbi:MAG: hypothetical protein R3B06_20430 [Kofleriaceae bacterium]
MANLRPGEAFIWSSKATDDAFTKSAVKIRCEARHTAWRRYELLYLWLIPQKKSSSC